MNILPQVMIPSRAGEICEESGIDSRSWFQLNPLHSIQKWKHFIEFPHKIIYEFNSRGFRDQEWPDDSELSDAIWCLGDSFTLGIGSPFSHIWPQVLQSKVSRRVINVSLDGASNEWISVMAEQIMTKVRPKHLIIMWSYLHRRYGIPDTKTRRTQQQHLSKGADGVWKDFYNNIKLEHWPVAPSLSDFDKLPERIRLDFRNIHVNDWLIISDDLTKARISDDLDRRIHAEVTSYQDDVDNIKACVTKVISSRGSTNVVQSIIPRFAPNHIVPEITEFLAAQAPCIEYFDQPLDWARDYHHFDIKTSQWIVDQILPFLSNRCQSNQPKFNL